MTHCTIHSRKISPEPTEPCRMCSPSYVVNPARCFIHQSPGIVYDVTTHETDTGSRSYQIPDRLHASFLEDEDISREVMDLDGPDSPNMDEDSGFRADDLTCQGISKYDFTSGTVTGDLIAWYYDVIIEDYGFEEYVHDIYESRRELEMKYHPVDCLDGQNDVTSATRAALVQWLTTIQHKLQLHQDTLFLAINIVDRYLATMIMSRDCLWLLGITALLIAAKHEEITPPEIEDLTWSRADVYSRKDVRDMEILVLAGIDYSLSVPTSKFFLEYFAMCNSAGRSLSEAQIQKRVTALARYALESSLQHYDLIQYPPSMHGFCAVQLAHEELCTYLPFFYPRDLDFRQEIYLECLHTFRLFVNSLLSNSTPRYAMLEYYLDL